MKRWLVLLIVWTNSSLFASGSIVCIHGLVSSSKDLSAVRNALFPAEKRIYLWDYPSTRYCFEEHGSKLCGALKQIAECYPGEPIDFVTHSSGALVLRSALNMPDCPDEAKIGRAVLFAPPNQGSELGRKFRKFLPLRIIIGSKSGLELMSYDRFMIHERFGCFPQTMEVLVIAGTKGTTLFFHRPNDLFIALDETYLDTPYYLVTYPVSHGKLLKCRPALCEMVNFIIQDCNCQPELPIESSGCELINSVSY